MSPRPDNPGTATVSRGTLAGREAGTTDTVFARASGAGRAAIAIIRVSGPAASNLTRRLAGSLPPPRTSCLRRLRDPATREVLDRALVLWLPGPASYTGEDSVEFHLHGGPAVVAGIADALVALGARPAEPGEFTRRAFLNGKLDLTAAEGIADLVAAETAAQRRQALRQAEGGLGRLYDTWTARLARLLAHQEASIEFADEDLPTDLGDRSRRGAAALCAEIRAHLDDGHRAERLRVGLLIAILGAPNVGKSSLLNALAEREAAIVSTRAGTTRDIVEVRLDLGGVPVTLCDTAGLREAADEIEAEGVRRALQRAELADLTVAMFAADQPLDEATLALCGPNSVVVVNKSDLAGVPGEIGGIPPITLSLRTGEGLPALRARLADEAARWAGLSDQAALTRPRHRAALREAAAWLVDAETAPLPEISAEALRASLRALGRLTGKVSVDAVLDLVFADFCIGK